MRAQGAFDPQVLKERLRTFTAAGAPLPAAVAADYRHFYHFNFEDVSPGWQHHMGWLQCDGEQLAVQLLQPAQPRGSAVLCHGYFDHAGLFEHVIRYLLSKQLTVLTFDQPGHGLSSGARASIDSFARYVRALERCLNCAEPLLPRPWFGVGQSMGGAVLMEHLLTVGQRFEDLVLFAPLVRPAHWGVNRLLYEVAKRTVVDRPRAITDNAENPEFMDLQRRDPLAPKRLPVAWVTAMVEWMHTFERRQSLPQVPKVIQGDADQTVAGRYNVKVLQRMVAPDPLPLLELAGGRHHLANEAEPLRDMIWHWLDGAVAWPAADDGLD